MKEISRLRKETNSLLTKEILLVQLKKWVG